MEAGGFFNSVNGDRLYKAEDFAGYFASFVGNGVFPNPSSNLQVVEGPGMQAVVKPGKAWINGYFFHSKFNHVFTLGIADGVFSRVDRIVVRWDLAAREMRLALKAGALSATPAAPELRRDSDVYELALADMIADTERLGLYDADPEDVKAALKAARKKAEG